MDISVIIVSWNVRDFLKRCLASIYRRGDAASFEVIVVDNASSDGSADMASREFPKARVIRNGKNLGFSAANNIGLKDAAGELVFFLNPDTELQDGTIGRIISFMAAHPEAAGLGCRLVYPDGSLQHSARRFPSFFTDLMEKLYLDWLFPGSGFFNYYHMGLWPHDRLREIDVPFGACLVVRKSVLDKIGPMDERFFMYYDEIDLCYRIRQAGFRIYFTPDISVTHHSNKSSDQVIGEATVWKMRSKAKFFRKHYGAPGAAGLVFNLIAERLLVYGPVSLWHLFTKKPANIAGIKEYLGLEWREITGAL